MDAGGIETLSFRLVWTAVGACGRGLEIYGSEGWGFESLRACDWKPLRCMGLRSVAVADLSPLLRLVSLSLLPLVDSFATFHDRRCSGAYRVGRSGCRPRPPAWRSCKCHGVAGRRRRSQVAASVSAGSVRALQTTPGGRAATAEPVAALGGRGAAGIDRVARRGRRHGRGDRSVRALGGESRPRKSRWPCSVEVSMATMGEQQSAS